jgi:hypothetical protein
LTAHAHTLRRWVAGQRFEWGGIAAIVLASVLVIWAVVMITRESSIEPQPATTVIADSAAELQSLVAPIRHFVFWVGPRQGYTYELTTSSNGSVRIRYLPPGESGSGGPYLTVATYPSLNPYSVISGIANSSGNIRLDLPGAGVGTHPVSDSTDVHAAYPGVDYQLEVYDPTPGSTLKLVTSGQLVPVTSS